MNGGTWQKLSQDQTRAMEVDQATGLGFAGDPMMVAYNSTLKSGRDDVLLAEYRDDSPRSEYARCSR